MPPVLIKGRSAKASSRISFVIDNLKSVRKQHLDVKTNPNSRAEIALSDNIQVIYNERKSFWKLRVDLDIVVALHTKQKCYEVIVYNPEIGQEAPRFYLDSDLISRKISEEEIHERVSERTEQMLRMKQNINQNTILAETIDNLLLTYILSRLAVDSLGSSCHTESFLMMFCPTTGDIIADEATQRLDFVYPEKPSTITPLTVIFHKKVR